MDQIKKLSNEELREITSSNGFNQKLTLKDYYATLLIYILKDIQGIYFKGGTALQKIFLEYSRLSEDVDYTCTRGISELKKEVKTAIKNSGLFTRVTKDKDVHGFVRLIAHYKDITGEEDSVFIDLNSRAKLIRKPEIHKIHHFYIDAIPEFSVKTLAQDEMVAEKVAATMGRNKPRDHFDVFNILEHGMKIDMKLVKKKCEQSGHEFSVLKMFNNAKKLKNRWEEDMIPILVEEVPFDQVIRVLARQFSLKEEKEKRKKTI